MWTWAINVSNVQAIVTAIQPIINFVSPIAITAIFLYFIRSFFD